jgi:nitrite reductase/ring-hydroxylating ferredoxin subunit
VAPPATSGPGALELPVVQVDANGSGAMEAPSWFELDGLDSLPEGGLTATEVQGRAIVVARVEGNLLAFRDACAGCGESLGEARLDEGTLTCPACGRAFFLPRAGRSLDDDRLLLAPVPLLAGAHGARVALGG